MQARVPVERSIDRVHDQRLASRHRGRVGRFPERLVVVIWIIVARIGPTGYCVTTWWFFDRPEGMMRFRELATETAGFYNTVGFNDDTRAFPSIPARHDVARRIDCAYLARLVAEHQLREEDAYEVAGDLAYNLPKLAYRL